MILMKNELITSNSDGYLSFLRLTPFEKSLEEKMNYVEFRQAALMEVQMVEDDHLMLDIISENEIILYSYYNVFILDVELKKITMSYTFDSDDEDFISHWWLQEWDEELAENGTKLYSIGESKMAKKSKN